MTAATDRPASRTVSDYATAMELFTAADEARQLWKALGVELRTADAEARQHNALHNRFRPHTRAGRSVQATMRNAMPADARKAAKLADRLRERRRNLHRAAEVLANAGQLDPYIFGPGIDVDENAAPTLRRIIDRWSAARIAAGESIETTRLNARRAALLAQIDQLDRRAERRINDARG